MMFLLSCFITIINTSYNDVLTFLLKVLRFKKNFKNVSTLTYLFNLIS